MIHIPYICIVGPTASGKSNFALRLAKQTGGVIVNGDSVQLYRGFDIGSAKPTPQERQQVEHHLFDVTNHKSPWDASKYAHNARKKILELIQKEGKTPIVVGGSGLYLRALWGQKFDDLPSNSELRHQLDQVTTAELAKQLQQLDPERAKQLGMNDRPRLRRAVELCTLLQKPVSQVYKETSKNNSGDFLPEKIIFLHPDRSLLHQQIAKRTKLMLSHGWIEETQKLLTEGCPIEAAPMSSIGYRDIANWILTPKTERVSKSELESRILAATRQYAKRQITWFKKNPISDEIRSTEMANHWLANFDSL